MAMKWKRKLRINGEELCSRHNGICPPPHPTKITSRKYKLWKISHQLWKLGRGRYQLHGRNFKAFLLTKVNMAPYWTSLEDEHVAPLWDHEHVMEESRGDGSRDLFTLSEMSESWTSRQHNFSHLLTFSPLGTRGNGIVVYFSNCTYIWWRGSGAVVRTKQTSGNAVVWACPGQPPPVWRLSTSREVRSSALTPPLCRGRLSCKR